VAHRRAKLTALGRRLLVDRILVDGMAVAHAADMVGVSRQTAWKWLRRFEAEGEAGLEDRSSRPHRSPRALSQARVDAVLAARHEHRLGPHRLAPLTGVPRSTIGDILARRGLSRLRDQDGPTGIPVRYVRERPGELLHVDVKKLGRIPDGGGHRVRGRATGTPRSNGGGYDYLHVAVDDRSRVAYVAVFGDERGATCARFVLDAAAFFASHGVRIERVLTDNAKNYTLSRAFGGALERIGARHRTTRPFRPQTNGKAERFNGTLLTEWAYVRRYDTNQARLDALPAFVAYYNERRPHGSLDGQSPMTALVNNVSVNHS
jgi:transposase InsO family protein